MRTRLVLFLWIVLCGIVELLSSCGGGETSVPQLSLNIDPTFLPAVVVNEPYNQTVVMTASGGTNSYVYDCMISGGAGITAVINYGIGPTTESRSCVISGTPLDTGTFTVYFRVTDATTHSSASAGPLSASINPPSNPLDNWHISSSIPTGVNLHAVAYGAGTFVAVGDNGVILGSSDGMEWTVRKTGTDGFLKGVAYGNGIFVVVGSNGIILTSPDGTIWTARNSGINDAFFTGVTYGNGIFVVVGYDSLGRNFSFILTSFDGAAWTTKAIVNNQTLTGVTYGGGRFIALGHLGSILSSPDAEVWSITDLSFPEIANGDAYYDLKGAAYGDGIFVVVGNFWPVNSIHGYHEARIFTSPDGTSWIQQHTGADSAFTLSAMTYGNGIFIAVGYSGATYPGSHPALIFSSPDGVSWTKRFITNEIASTVWYFLSGVTFGNGTFVAVGGDKILQSGS